MTSEQINLKERYILEEDKEEFFETLVKNSETYLVMKINDHLSRYGLDLPSESEKELKNLLNQRFNGQEQNKVQFKLGLLKIQKETDQGKRTALIKKFNTDFLNHNLDYHRPAHIKESQGLKAVGEVTLGSTIPQSALDTADFAKAKEIFFKQSSQQLIKKFKTNSHYKFDLKRLLEKNKQCFEYLCGIFPDYSHIKDFAKILKKYVKEARKTNKSFHCPDSYYGKMTLAQLEVYKKEFKECVNDKNFIRNHFKKTFEVPLNSFPGGKSNRQEYRNTLIRMYQWTKRMNVVFENFQAQIILAILENGEKLGIYDTEYFKLYLANPCKPVSGFNSKQNQVIRKRRYGRYDSSWLNIHNIKNVNNIDGNKIIERHLQHFFKTAKNSSAYEKHFTPSFIRQIYYSTKLKQGENIDKITEIYSEKQLQTIKESRVLKFCETNKTGFAHEEEVKIKLTIKNIPNLTINIFEINPENYYRKNKNEINAKIKLDGLLPAKQLNISFKEKPIIEFEKEFVFDEITNRKRGIFVLEFIGGGLSSRAMIRKGSLTLVQQTIKTGIVFHVVDEKKNICNNENTSILFAGKLYKTDAEGKILIPYSSTRSNSLAIVIDQEFAELVNITIPAEKIKFDASLLFNEESLFPGCQTRFILQPKLFCNGKLISMATLTEVKAEIVVVNDRGVRNSRKYDNLKLSYSEDLVLSYIIPPKIKSLVLSLTGKYKGLEGKEIPISTTKSISILKFDGKELYYRTYLKQSNEGYKLQFLGLNGEPYGGYTSSITGLTKYGSIQGSQVTFNLKTDKKGEIHLGNLDNFTNIAATMKNYPGNSKPGCISFQIGTTERVDSIPSTFTIAEKEDLTLPLGTLNNSTDFNALNYSLVKMNESRSYIIGDYRGKITKGEGSTILISGLDQGSYRFRYINELSNKTINLTVHKGKRWSLSNQYLIRDKCISKLMNEGNFLSYDNMKLVDNKLTLNINSHQLDTAKVHVLGFNHVCGTISKLKSGLKSFIAHENEETFEIGKSENSFLSEKNLSDEIKYVLERKRKTRFMGNTLEKPSSLLKRHFNKKTSAETETLQQERDYSATAGNISNSTRVVKSGGAIGGSSNLSIQFDQANQFLKYQGAVVANLKPNEDGLIEQDLQVMKNYGTIMVVIEDSRSSIVELLSNKESKIEKKSITLQKSKTANKVYLYDRSVAQLSKGGVFSLAEMNNTEMSLIEDRKSLFSMLKLIKKTSGIDEWEFLAEWDSLEPEKQLAKYDKYISHEFNLFAYFQDKEFFDLVVKEHLLNKVEKELIDYFLLGQYNQLEQYLNPQSFQKLNLLECSLLILAFKDTHKETCEKILKILKENMEIREWSINEYKRIFDTVLTAQKAKQEVSQEATTLRSHSRAGPGRIQNVAMTQQFSAPRMMQQQIQQPMMQQAMSNFEPLMMNYIPQQMMQQQQQMSNRSRAPAGYGNRSNRRQQRQQNSYGSNAYGGYQNADLQLEQAYNAAPTNYRSASVPVNNFRTIGVTNEYVERQYFFQNPSFSQNSNSVKFWVDYIEHILKGGDAPFLSENFIYATSCSTEIIAVLSLINLPEKKEEHQTNNEEGFTLTAASNCMVFSKEMKEKGNEKLELDVLISQRFFDPNDRYVYSKETKTRMFKKLSEFLIGKVYGARIAITNSSESEHQVQVITEIPQGAIPVIKLDYSKSTTMKLDPLSTKIVEYSFYFPESGEFTCYPASITKDGYLVASASNTDIIKVTKEQTKKELNTIKDILASGSQDDILTFMKEQNLANPEIFRFSSIYWLLKDKKFYEQVLAILKDRFIFDPVVWRFSIYHGDYKTFKDLLNNQFHNAAISLKGFKISYLKNKILNIDDFKFKEYNPLINPRVHDIGQHKHNILNRDFRDTYHNFLTYLVDKRVVESKDYVYLGVYFLLQDRIDDALDIYTKINVADLEEKELMIQYDYLTAYLDLYKDYPKFTKAREICDKYLTYPIFTWRNRFIDLINQIAEFDGEVTTIEQAETEEKKNQKKNNEEADKSEYIKSILENGRMKFTVKNVTNFTISYYKIDLEIMFSQDPFLSVDRADYSFVRANKVEKKTCEKTETFGTFFLDIPDEFKNSNMLIQITSGAKSENLTYFPTSLQTFIVENYGQIKVTSKAGKPISKVYVKCFSKKKDGTVKFYKDGYTDLRGTFDYATLNLDGVRGIDKFSLLVVSEDMGSLIQQTKPPCSMSKVENKALKLNSQKMYKAQQARVSKCKKSNKWMM